MLVKMNVPENSEVGLVAATTIEATHRDGKEKWDPDSGASFHRPHTQARMIAHKMAPAGASLRLLMEPFCR